MKWINFGGGHHITRKDYDVEKLIGLINDFKKKYDVEVYLEPGEAIGWETGSLISTVLDIVDNGMKIAILDTSAEAHMPDTIIMPYRADVRDSGKAGEKAHTYRLAGNTCLAGDIMGDYSFDDPLKVGDKIIFEDQMHYTMVKATTFNGIKQVQRALPLAVFDFQQGHVSFDVLYVTHAHAGGHTLHEIAQAIQGRVDVAFIHSGHGLLPCVGR